MKVCINAGHAPNGNPDPGAVGQTGLRESDVADDISQLVMYYLQQAGYDTIEIQDDDLQTICNASNNFNADLFISIHCNAAANNQARGTEVFYLSANKLAQCIQTQIIDSMGTVDRGIKDGSNLYVIKHTNAPSVLVECAFISNSEDECMLADKEQQDGFSRAIARGITDYVQQYVR